MSRIFILLAAGIILAYLAAKAQLPERSPAAFLFILSFAVAALFWRESETIVDASRYFIQAKHLAVYGAGYFLREWGRDIPAWTDMPLIPFLYGLIFAFFGEARIYIQIFTTSLFSLTIVATYFLGKELWGKEVGIYAGLSLLSMPYILSQAPLMLVDVPTMFLLTLSVYTSIMALKHGRLWVPASSFSLFLAFFSKYSAWLMLSGIVIIFFVYIVQESGNRRKTILFRGFAVAFISSLFIGIVLWYKFDVFSEQIRFLITYQKPGLKRWGESFLSTFFFQAHPFITIAALYATYRAFRKKDLKYAIAIWPVLLILVFQIKRIRYTMPVFPMFALMAAYGFNELGDKKTGQFAALCAMACSLVVAVFAYLPLVEKMSSANIKSAGEFLDTLGADTCEVFVLPLEDPVLNSAVSVPLLDIFTKKTIRYDYHPPSRPTREEREKSPLRFTWEYRNPAYYRPAPAGKYSPAVVIISDKPGRGFPAAARERIKNLPAVKDFSLSDDLFISQILVTVYY